MREVGLYHPRFEHDACGVGLVARLDGVATHDVIEKGLEALCRLAHRGAAGADSDTGDGAGVLIRIPDSFLRSSLPFPLPPAGTYGVGMAFMAPGERGESQARMVADICAAEGWTLAGWREVPVNPGVLGQAAASTMPAVRQFFAAAAGENGPGGADALERRLYILRKRLESEAIARGFDAESFYLPSLSSRIVIYKGMMLAAQLKPFYADLGQPGTVSPFAIVHQRYSTNTFPSWRLAQPFRTLAHNGEINTIRGNRAWLSAREPSLRSPLFGDEIRKIFPIAEEDASDSASLDNALELLLRGGRELPHAMGMLIPEAWGKKYPMGPDLRGFFEFHAGIMEPWDGPAAVVFTDGFKVGACLDRNGLRPARYSVLDDGLMVLASEAGVLDLPPERVVSKGALRPGQMILADIGGGRVVGNRELKAAMARRQPYRRWVDENRLSIPGFLGKPLSVTLDAELLPFRQRLFGYTRDDADIILGPMAAKGVEPTGSMGADIPLAVLSDRPQPLFAYFRQQFAQITNPPLDSVREELVMSMMTFIGNDPNILDESPAQARLLKMERPILSNEDIARLREAAPGGLRLLTLDAVFPVPAAGDEPGKSLTRGLARLEADAEEAVKAGTDILILSDKKAGAGHLPIPSILAVAAVNRRLMRTGARVSVGLICETGEARETSHLAMLLSLGASAANPWLAFDTAVDLAIRGELPAGVGPAAAVDNCVHALSKGILKIMSKMGISTLRGYRGARAFEAVGIGQALIDRYFPGIASRVGGIGLEQLERDAVARFDDARPFSPAALKPGESRRMKVSELEDPETPAAPLPTGGAYRYRKNGERHLWTPETITLLQKAVRLDDYAVYRRYAERINNQAAAAFTLRGLLSFVPGTAVPVGEVEAPESIMRRFVTGAMSFGSLSREAHETLALAMNSIGARSNSGEGGEDPMRFRSSPSRGVRHSAVKQVASGRFGVTLAYLADADELQIKISQGAKPGEGGQLPGHKVNAEIARVRHSTPGVTLISPPPHHDIYSIEDIAQLIYDLRQANPEANVSVKLASEAGVGTVAAGAAKAGADIVVIAGHDGGTGASPLSSIRNAGSPWEIGLAETQQTLILNRLRGRVRLQADGQMKTGRDIAVAALLGADEFAFATAPLVSMGCLMMRKCHTNGCPVGIATQDADLRARFAGKPEHVLAFFRFVAMELREIMAALGFRRLEDMIGRADMLAANPDSAAVRERGVDLSRLGAMPDGGARRFTAPAATNAPSTLDERLAPELEACLAGGGAFRVESPVANTDRAVGTGLSARIVKARGAAGLDEDTATIRLVGSAGQSFGAFSASGLTLDLVGEANDYVGKGLSGGKIIIRPPAAAAYPPGESMIAGNVCLYGATGGELYLGGRAGERFAVRNSGAVAVVEGVGDHGCEYMTGGVVAVLGSTGVNFAAGMSGGIAYVLDADGLFDTRCNLEMIDLDPLGAADEEELRRLLERHARFTGSPRALRMLGEWDEEKTKFVKVFPMEYRRALGEMLSSDAATPRLEKEFV